MVVVRNPEPVAMAFDFALLLALLSLPKLRPQQSDHAKLRNFDFIIFGSFVELVRDRITFFLQFPLVFVLSSSLETQAWQLSSQAGPM